MTAARRAGIAAILTSVIGVFADLGYLGWDQAVITGRRKPRGKDLTPAQRPRIGCRPSSAVSANAATRA